MIKINLAKRKRAAAAGGASDFKKLNLSELTSTVTNVIRTFAGGSDGKKFDINGPIPKLVICVVFAWVVEDTLTGYRADQIKAVEAQITAVDVEKKTVLEKLAKIKGYEPIKKQLEDDERAIRNKLEVVTRLLENRNAPSKMMMQIAQSIPEEVWLTNLVVEEKSVKLAGATPGYTQVSDFIKALNSTSQFGEIGLSGIQETTNASKDQRVQTFELHAKRRGSD